MSRYYSDPTANAAIGAVETEMNAMRKKAERIRKRRQSGQLTSREIAAARKEFTGIYRRLLEDALEED